MVSCTQKKAKSIHHGGGEENRVGHRGVPYSFFRELAALRVAFLIIERSLLAAGIYHKSHAVPCTTGRAHAKDWRRG